VELVLLEVPQVVEDVVRARQDAEGNESRGRLDEHRLVRDVLGKNERGENEEILDPLLGTEGFEDLYRDHGLTLSYHTFFENDKTEK
jgi:hypothetical protein